MAQVYYLERALLEDGWASNVLLEVNGEGNIHSLLTSTRFPGHAHAHYFPGTALPGMPNLHSHAFQRALAGGSEFYSGAGDNFWSWRRQMYQLVDRLEPRHLQAVAAQLYLEMLKAGYTAVAEFHYLHHDRRGAQYDDVATLSRSLLRAAGDTGIALTLLPVLYMQAGFAGGELTAAQRRFGFSRVEDFLHLFSCLHREAGGQLTLGVAPHSLRAVPLAALQETCAEIGRLAPESPIHIHIAEQQREVEECLAHSGRRPVQLLCENVAVGQRWCLVHATHLDEGEIETLAGTGAVAGLCPTTEANLGDGFFTLSDWQARGGRLGIGSDSNASVSPVEELRWLEYGQRLWRQRRNIFASEAAPHVGANLWRAACRGGAQALGRGCGVIAVGARADLVVLDHEHAALLGREDDTLIDSLVFSGNSNPVAQVVSGGNWLIRDGRHDREEEIKSAFARTMGELK